MGATCCRSLLPLVFLLSLVCCCCSLLSFTSATRLITASRNDDGLFVDTAANDETDACSVKVGRIDYSSLQRVCLASSRISSELCCDAFDRIIEPLLEDISSNVKCADDLFRELERRGYNVALFDAFCHDDRKELLESYTTTPGSESPVESKQQPDVDISGGVTPGEGGGGGGEGSYPPSFATASLAPSQSPTNSSPASLRPFSSPLRLLVLHVAIAVLLSLLHQ